MELVRLRTSIALVALGALAACGGGGGATGTGQMLPARAIRSGQQSILTRIVGVGDSLTAGYQSDGFLGQANVKNPLNPSTYLPPGQENGWWALLNEQASSSPLQTAIDQMYDPTTSPLPLIRGPGLDNQIVPTGVSLDPFGQFKGSDACTFDDGFNESGFLYRGSARVRMNPSSSTIRDFGIPGMTLHEANVLHQPQTDTCSPLPGIPGLLSDVVSEESGTFWPVLRNFTKLDGQLTQVNAAASVHPTLATVWLGANDVLKFMGSGGRFVGGDRTVGQVASDLLSTTYTLEDVGARVVIANIPNVLEAGYFQRMTSTPKTMHDCKIRTYASCLLITLFRLPPSILPEIEKQYNLATPHGCAPTSVSNPCGYLTLPAVLEIVQYYAMTGEVPNLNCSQPAPSCKSVPGSGLGSNYITPEFAGEVQALNNIVNEGIDKAATTAQVPLINVEEVVDGIASGNPSNPYFRLAASVQPGICCTLGYLYGVFSFDGIHPSNTGYALIAYEFIDTINHAYRTRIPQVDVNAVYSGTRCSNKTHCFPDPYAPH
jgi:lysophospholipase L1-like esterase